MHSPASKLKAIHYTRWVFHPRLPSYVPGSNQPFAVVSVYERSGPMFTQHLFIHLN